MSRRHSLLVGALVLAPGRVSSPAPAPAEDPADGAELRLELDPTTGLPGSIVSGSGEIEREWLTGPIELSVRRASDGRPAEVAITHDLLVGRDRARWEVTLTGEVPRVEHEINLTLPVLFPGARIFTPSQYGVMDVDAYPTFEPAPYGSYDWEHGQAYVLPLVSVQDPASDRALTVALPADDNIPHLEVDWSDGERLHLRLGRRGLGGESPITLRFLLYAHAADYRSALRVYAEEYPAWFHPGLPRGSSEGTFWYHHIHDHPGFDELSRQHVRFVWTSFWFPWLGEFLPQEEEWYPYTYARWWRLERKLSDEAIRSFARDMRAHDIGTFAYFNVTEYGGAGGERGDSVAADRILEEKLGPALVRGADGKNISTWEGSMVINPGRDLPYRPLLVEQARRHLSRLPELEGFLVDRLDWASRFDFGAHDGLSMIGDSPVENLAVPVGDAVRELCTLAHAEGKRVFVNQFWRVEILRDTDGYCHENDFLPAMGYLAPFRPASAWHQREDYTGDLLAFEAQMKRRLHWALFPQMIAHEFPVSQQPPNERAADLMELYAPLFEPLLGKRQVLSPHCVEVTGPNEVNLFRNGDGHFVAPVSSRVQFLCRPPRVREPAGVTLRGAGVTDLSWAHVYSIDGPPYRTPVSRDGGVARVHLAEHGASSLVVVGGGAEPPLAKDDTKRLAALRDRWFPDNPRREVSVNRPIVEDVRSLELELWGQSVGVSHPTSVVDVLVDGRKVGEIRDAGDGFDRVTKVAELPERPPAVGLLPRDEGSWFVPEGVSWVAHTLDGRRVRVASWGTGDPSEAEGSRGMSLPLHWCEPVTLPTVTASFAGEDLLTGGEWVGKFGALGSWFPGQADAASPPGFALRVGEGRVFVWSEEVREDPRVLRDSDDPTSPPRAACWYDEQAVEMSLVPPGDSPYRLTVYLLDFDLAGRRSKVAVRRGRFVLAEREVSPDAMRRGAYVTWTVTGPVVLRVENVDGANAVVCGVFVSSP